MGKYDNNTQLVSVFPWCKVKLSPKEDSLADSLESHRTAFLVNLYKDPGSHSQNFKVYKFYLANSSKLKLNNINQTQEILL